MDKNNKDKILNEARRIRKFTLSYIAISFGFVVIFLIFYLVSSKNNRMCQYGGTLFCNNEIHYTASLGEENTFFTITYSDYTGSENLNVKYPYSGTSTYNIDYYFNSLPASITNRIVNIGISSNGSIGSSIYFQNSSVTGEAIQTWTRYSLITSDIKNKILVGDIDKTSNTVLEYTYYDDTTRVLNNIQPTSNSFFSSSTTQANNHDPLPVNWLHLLKPLRIQAAGCSVGNTSACAVIDPSFVSPKSCSQYYFNSNTSFYCPPSNPNCSLCSETQNSRTDNCGYRFCRPGLVPQDKTGFHGGTTGDVVSTNSRGYYQNNYIPGKRAPDDPDAYVIGDSGDKLIDKLDGLESSNFNSSSDSNGLAAYPMLQQRTIAAGTGTDKNNFDNSTRLGTTSSFTNSSQSSYYPQFATQPNTNTDGNFDFK